MGDLLIVASKVKALAKKNGMNTASDFMPAFNKLIMDKIVAKCNIAKAFGKKTLSAQTLGHKKK
ncbi:MAG: hypothetical protein PHC66_00345 [Candidatus Nanoarchaeia archaeon]|nr:hypothetical protein [Candidatus Nanoarchaeia archaeon]MDD5239601.1 hypothetical protein [Candidatus Nanoarchaeia archaeon]